MVSVTVLLATAATFWGSAAPGVAQTQCPDGVRYNVKTAAAMVNQARGVTAEAQLGSCVITFRAGRLRTYNPVDACGIVIHEYGHAALKLGHTVGGIMDAESVGKRPPGICMQFRNR